MATEIYYFHDFSVGDIVGSIDRESSQQLQM